MTGIWHHARWCLSVCAVLACCPRDAAAARQFYRLESAVTLTGAAPSWDYLTFEPGRSYLYIGRRHDGVTVYDVTTGKTVGSIDNTEGANATALAAEFDRGYTANEDGSTTIFRMSTLKTIARVKFGDDADAAFYEPVTKQIMVTMGDSRQLAFVDAATGAIAGKIKMESGKLEATAPDGKGNLYVAERDRNSVAQIDARQRKVTAEWAIQGCDEPTGLAMDPVHRRIFVGCRGKAPVLAILDADSGKTIATLEIGRGNDGVVYDPDSRSIFTSNGVDGNLVIFDQIDPDTYKLAEAPTTRPAARTMAFDPKARKIYLVTAEGTVDPSKKVNRTASPFYPNAYFPDSFTLLTFSKRFLTAQ